MRQPHQASHFWTTSVQSHLTRGPLRATTWFDIIDYLVAFSSVRSVPLIVQFQGPGLRSYGLVIKRVHSASWRMIGRGLPTRIAISHTYGSVAPRSSCLRKSCVRRPRRLLWLPPWMRTSFLPMMATAFLITGLKSARRSPGSTTSYA